jgi:hypothetical protein
MDTNGKQPRELTFRPLNADGSNQRRLTSTAGNV